MKVVTPYDPETGLFGATVSMPDSAFARFVSSGKPFKQGRFDRLSHRVEAGEVVDRALTDAERQVNAASLAHRQAVADIAAKRRAR